MASNTELLLYIGIVTLFVILGVTFFTRERADRGTWQTVFDSGCQNDNQGCTIPGTQSITQQCILGPNNTPCRTQGGVTTFNNQTLTTVCNVTCQASNWQVFEGPCTVPGTCFDIFTMTPMMEVKKICSPIDPQGVNNCIVFDDITQTSTVYNIGDVVITQEGCDLPIQPVCGDWVIYNGFSITDICQVNSFYIETPDCAANQPLGEGFFTVQMACLEPDGTIISPLPSDPTITECPKIPCTDVKITPDMTIPDNPVICANNPQCLQVCRLSPFTNPGSPTFNSIINKYLILTTPGGSGVVTTFNVPQNPPSSVKFNPPPPDNNPVNPLPNVSLILTSTSYNTGTCSANDVIFNTGLVFRIAPLSGIQARIMLIVNSTLYGWLGVDSSNVLQWTQAQMAMGGVGITSSQATIFNVVTDGSTISITLTNGSPVFVINDSNIPVPLTGMSINGYDLSTNLTPREISPCNKLLSGS